MAIAINGIAIEFEEMAAEEAARKIRKGLERDHKMGCLHSYTEKTMSLRWGKKFVLDDDYIGRSGSLKIGKYVPELEQMEVCQTCGKLIWVPVPTEE